MRMKWSAVLILAFMLAGCDGGSSGDGWQLPRGNGYHPDIDPANFQATIDNPYLPFTPGTAFKYTEVTADGASDVVVTVTDERRVIMGVSCIIVHDQVTTGGVIEEDTWDWYAQDLDGNVWYFGEDMREFDAGGHVVSTKGSWEADLDGAQPGIVMPAAPVVGDSFRQEYYAGFAEDMIQILGTAPQPVTVPYGSFTDCIKTKDWSRLEPGMIENKWFCNGVGMVRAKNVAGDASVESLISVTP